MPLCGGRAFRPKGISSPMIALRSLYHKSPPEKARICKQIAASGQRESRTIFSSGCLFCSLIGQRCEAQLYGIPPGGEENSYYRCLSQRRGPVCPAYAGRQRNILGEPDAQTLPKFRTAVQQSDCFPPKPSPDNTGSQAHN